MEEMMETKVEEQQTEQLEEQKVTQKRPLVHIIYCIVLVLVIAGGVTAVLFIRADYEKKYKKAVAEQQAEYEAAEAKYETALANLLTEEAQWKQEVADMQEQVNDAFAQTEAVYAERQAKIDAETARWNALTPEEQKAELIAKAYNEMILALRAENEEYRSLYVTYSEYLTVDIFSLGAEEALAYTELHARKIEIEQAYLAEHPIDFSALTTEEVAEDFPEENSEAEDISQ